MLYAGIYFALGYVRYAGHRNFVDMGIFAQTAASAFGCFCNTVEGSHWAFHFSPVLYLAGALMKVWPSALALVALQAVAGALTAPAIYGIVARHADRGAARLAALVVLLYPPLAGAIFNDFHENGLAPAAVAWLLWAFDAGSVAWTIVFALLALSVKEDQALFIAIAGAIGAITYRRDPWRLRLAGTIAVLSAFVFVLYFAAIQPHASANAHWAPTRFYAWTAGDLRALVPTGVLQRIGFVLLALVPLLFIPFRTPALLAAAAPLLEVLASRMSTTFTMGSHYAGEWAGWLLYAFAIGAVAMWQRSPSRARRLLYWCVGLCVVEFAAADPLHPGYFLHGRTQADVALDRFLSTLPPQLSVATQEEAYTHLAATDPNAGVLPETPDVPIRACAILIDTAYPKSPRLVESGPLVRTLIASGTYALSRRDGTISLYTRRSPCR
jgi:uncharacterized membrane protein